MAHRFATVLTALVVVTAACSSDGSGDDRSGAASEGFPTVSLVSMAPWPSEGRLPLMSCRLDVFEAGVFAEAAMVLPIQVGEAGELSVGRYTASFVAIPGDRFPVLDVDYVEHGPDGDEVIVESTGGLKDFGHHGESLHAAQFTTLGRDFLSFQCAFSETGSVVPRQVTATVFGPDEPDHLAYGPPLEIPVDPSVPRAVLPVVTGEGSSEVSRRTGDLIELGGCVVLAPADVRPVFLVLWPDGYTMAAIDLGTAIVDEEHRVIALIGDRIAVRAAPTLDESTIPDECRSVTEFILEVTELRGRIPAKS